MAEYTVTLVKFHDRDTQKTETVLSTGAIPAMLTAEKNNPGWLSVSAEAA